MKEFFKNLIYKGLSFFDFDGAVILMYHSIDWNKEFFTVSPDDFAKQMEFLKDKKVEVVKLTDLSRKIDGGKIKKSTVVITFDDGYEDNYKNAFPILKKFNFPATIFTPSNLIDTSVKSRNGVELKILNETQIKEMAESGIIEIGSHGCYHKKLSQLNKDEIIVELENSKKSIENITGQRVCSIAYPFGNFNDLVKEISGDYYEIGCAVEKGRIRKNSDVMALNRNSIDSKVTFEQFKGIIKYGRV